jgi:hypothetical protein
LARCNGSDNQPQQKQQRYDTHGGTLPGAPLVNKLRRTHSSPCKSACGLDRVENRATCEGETLRGAWQRWYAVGDDRSVWRVRQRT